MKKIYGIIGAIVLIVIVIALSILKNNNGTTATSVKKIYQARELFTERDLEQNANTSNATKYTVSDEDMKKIYNINENRRYENW